jgi:hypothetical protein
MWRVEVASAQLREFRRIILGQPIDQAVKTKWDHSLWVKPRGPENAEGPARRDLCNRVKAKLLDSQFPDGARASHRNSV